MTSTETRRARSLRPHRTSAERKLWLRLRDRRLGGYKVVRQCPIGPYFACREARLIVELDGSQHAESRHDVVRDAFLNRQGYAVLRFWNDEIFTAMASVCETILAALEGRLDAYDRFTLPSSALSGTFSPHAGRREPLDERPSAAERCPSPRAGDGFRRTDEGKPPVQPPT